jgi:hypothetical protein
MGPRRRPAVPGWHDEFEAARLLGEHIQVRRKKRRLGIGPPFVVHGRSAMYRDGCEAEYFASMLNQKVEPPRRRGRPRKAEASDAAE